MLSRTQMMAPHDGAAREGDDTAFVRLTIVSAAEIVVPKATDIAAMTTLAAATAEEEQGGRRGSIRPRIASFKAGSVATAATLGDTTPGLTRFVVTVKVAGSQVFETHAATGPDPVWVQESVVFPVLRHGKNNV